MPIILPAFSVDPPVISPEDRVAKLRPLLTDPHWESQTANILKLIELYESGAAPPLTSSSPGFWLMDGEIVQPVGEDGIPHIPKGSVAWHENEATVLAVGNFNSKLCCYVKFHPIPEEVGYQKFPAVQDGRQRIKWASVP